MTRYVTGPVLALVGLLYLAGVILALLSLPGTLTMYSKEPEDTHGLVLLVLVGSFIAYSGLVTSWALLRPKNSVPHSPKSLRALCLISAMILMVLCILGFAVPNPTSFELQVQVIPAIFFLIAGVSLSRAYVAAEPE